MLGKNIGDLKNTDAPCVLVVAEFHRRLFTAQVAPERDSFTANMGSANAQKELNRIYDVLYGDSYMTDLKAIAKVIIKTV